MASKTPDRGKPHNLLDGARAYLSGPVDVLGISKRLQKDPRWLTVIEPLRTRMMRECRQKSMSKAEAQAWTYSELDRLYPPLSSKNRDSEIRESLVGNDLRSDCPTVAQSDSGRVQGLGEIPAGWPDLPANASLAAEIAWVQANRLYVVEERPSGATVVRLDRACEPAPSRAALGWLETSIRSYAKYVDVAAKATAQQQDEAEHVRREKLAIEEIRSLLAEMMPGED